MSTFDIHYKGSLRELRVRFDVSRGQGNLKQMNPRWEPMDRKSILEGDEESLEPFNPDLDLITFIEQGQP